MSKRFIIGVDIGTTSTKAVLFNSEGIPVTKHLIEYPLHTPTPSTAEQDPDEILAAVVQTIRTVIDEHSLLPKDISFVSFSSAMHSLIAVDEQGMPLTSCITWADQRSVSWSEKIAEEHNGHEIYRRTGTPIHPVSPLCKLVWLRNEHPEIFQNTTKFISIKEYAFHQFFHTYVIDHSIASATGLFNLEKLDWDEEALQLAGINAEKLSSPVPTTSIISGLDDTYQGKLGLDKDTTFVIGASDGVLSNLGVDAVDPGIAAITIGTSGAIRTVTDRPVTDPEERTFCYALTENMWVVGGAVNNGAVALRWIREQFSGGDELQEEYSYDHLTQLAETVPPGSEGLLFHPYLTGERAPLWNSNARGSFFGLGLHHQKAHLIRSVLEGVIFNLYSVSKALEEMIGTPRQIKATGGFAKSELWRQIMADIFNQEVTVPESHESSCLGAVVLGMKAIGSIDHFGVISDYVGSTHAHTPVQKNAAQYQQLFPLYERISEKFSEEYKAIADYQKGTKL
ncbi:gluconokinase [Halobacillus yeomjeoni]|uniref:Gluconokinase n=1 Tax=Halobacillus yeomjeoni TaxID=311194 RepID=A0A931MTS3_9BACI|nr:gluconokinase [Halobacillus yeomjeoni]MBH0229138.1 gluconokinase [Halobacillus yeomjeoni]